MISVVIPSFNEEFELPGCLAHIKAAARRCGYNIEIIVVDNASTDMTYLVAIENGAIVVNESRKGISFARQTGFNAARGSIICCIDADTRMPSRWFFQMINNFRCGVLAVSGPSYFYDAPPHHRFLALLFNINAYFVYLATGAMLQGGNFAVRRDALKAAGEFNTAIEFYGEDQDLALRLSRLGKISWSWDMSMPSSSRRFRAEGIVKTGLTYAANYFWVMFLGHPLSKTHKDIRCSS